jgi:hypothetical protein
MTKQPSTHSVVITALGELVGVSILAIFADSSDVFGKFAVALMAGWLLIFMMSNADWLSSLTSKL